MDAKQTVLQSSRHRMYLPPPSEESTSRLSESSQNKSPPAAQLSGRPAFSDPRAASQASALSQVLPSRQFTVVQEREIPLEILRPEQINTAHKDWPRIVESFSGCDPKFSLEKLEPTDLLRLATLLKTKIEERSDKFKAIAFSLFTTAIKSGISFKSKHWAPLFMPYSYNKTNKIMPYSCAYNKTNKKSIEEYIHKDLSLLKNNRPKELAKRISLRLSQESPHKTHDNMMLLHIITTPPEEWSPYRAQFLEKLQNQCDTPGLEFVLENFNHFQLSTEERSELRSKVITFLTPSPWMYRSNSEQFQDITPSLIQSGLFDDPFLGESETLLEQLVSFTAYLHELRLHSGSSSDSDDLLGARIAKAIGQRTYQAGSIWEKHIFKKIALYLDGEWQWSRKSNSTYISILKNLQFGPEILPADIQLKLLCEVCEARKPLPIKFDLDSVLAQFPAVSFDQFIQKLSHLLTTKNRLHIIRSSAALQKNPELLERLAIIFSIIGWAASVRDLLVELLPSPKTCVYDPDTQYFFPKSVPSYFYFCLAHETFDAKIPFIDLLEKISPADREAIVECCKKPDSPMTASQSTIIDLIKIDVPFKFDTHSMKNLSSALKEKISTLDATKIFELIESTPKIYAYGTSLLFSGWITQQVQSTAFKSNQKYIRQIIDGLLGRHIHHVQPIGLAVSADRLFILCLYLLGSRDEQSARANAPDCLSFNPKWKPPIEEKHISLIHHGETFEIQESLISKQGALLIALLEALLIATQSIEGGLARAEIIKPYLAHFRTVLIQLTHVNNDRLDNLLGTIQKISLTPLLSRLNVGSLSVAQILSAFKDKCIQLKESGSINAESVLALATEFKALNQTITAINSNQGALASLKVTVQSAGKILINEKQLIDSVCAKLHNLEAQLEIETDATAYLQLKDKVNSFSRLAELIHQHGQKHLVDLTPAQEKAYDLEMKTYTRAMETYDQAILDNERYNRDNAAALNWNENRPLTYHEGLARSGHSYGGDGMSNYAQWSAMQQYPASYFERPYLPPRPAEPEKPSMPNKPYNYEPYDHTSEIRNILTSMRDQLPD